MSALSLACRSAARFCSSRAASSSCSRCFKASGDTVALACGAAAWAAAGVLLPPVKTSAAHNGTQASQRRRAVSGNDGVDRASRILSEKIALCLTRILRAMIGVACQNRRGPVELLQKHDADHLMRPGRRPEGDPDLCLASQFGRKSVRAANDENSVGDGLVSPLAQLAGKRGTVDIVAPLVEGDKHGVFRDCGRD